MAAVAWQMRDEGRVQRDNVAHSTPPESTRSASGNSDSALSAGVDALLAYVSKDPHNDWCVVCIRVVPFYTRRSQIVLAGRCSSMRRTERFEEDSCISS